MRAGSRISGRQFAAKLFAAVGAACLVASFAVASLMRPFATLAELLLMMDHRMFVAWNRAEHSPMATWLWMHLAMPLLVRPAWLLPTGVGLVCVGAATSFAWGQEAARR